MPDIEIPEIETKDPERDKLNIMIAVSVAVLSTFIALSNIKDGNIVQAMTVAQSGAVDTWSQFQAKRMRQAMSENAVREGEMIREIVPAERKATVDKLIATHKADIARYEKDKKELSEKAKGLEAEYEKLGNKDDQFDLADAVLTLSLTMMAMTALIGKKSLLYFAWAMMALGFFIGIGGFVGYAIHPDALIKVLT
ncbi:MAG: hypothetical protein JWM80_5681 [Cyanobacteria bacterium RYN_339]|nr:hypothetical protein [Cyanobacteria bacterium RYN_339]